MVARKQYLGSSKREQLNEKTEIDITWHSHLLPL